MHVRRQSNRWRQLHCGEMWYNASCPNRIKARNRFIVSVPKNLEIWIDFQSSFRLVDSDISRSAGVVRNLQRFKERVCSYSVLKEIPALGNFFEWLMLKLQEAKNNLWKTVYRECGERFPIDSEKNFQPV